MSMVTKTVLGLVVAAAVTMATASSASAGCPNGGGFYGGGRGGVVSVGFGGGGGFGGGYGGYGVGYPGFGYGGGFNAYRPPVYRGTSVQVNRVYQPARVYQAPLRRGPVYGRPGCGF